MLALVVALTAAAGPEPAVAAALAAAANTYSANLATFPTLTVNQTVRFRAGDTLAAALASAPPNPDATSTVRVFRHHGRTRYTHLEDAASGRALDNAVLTKSPDGTLHGPVVHAKTDDRLGGADGRRLWHDRRHHQASVAADTPVETEHFVLAQLVTEPAPQVDKSDLPGFVDAALAGRVAADIRQTGDRLTLTFTASNKGVYTFDLDAARGHLPTRIRAEYDVTDPPGRLIRETVVEPRTCSGNRWFPGRVACACVAPGISGAIGWEYQVTELDADRQPPDDAFQFTLPAGTLVWNQDDKKKAGFRAAETITVGPDDLGDLVARTAVGQRRPPPDHRVVGGSGPTPSELKARRSYLLWGGILLVAALVAVAWWVRRGRQ